MTVVRAFRAVRYDSRRVELAKVIAPPYDVITPDEWLALFARDAHNAIRLELTRRVEEEATTDYAEAARALDAWRRAGILVRDPQPALYGLRQRFTAADGAPAVREGFFAALRLEDLSRGVVRPHESTLSGPKADRLKLLRAVRANVSSIFLLYEDPDRRLSEALSNSFDDAVLTVAYDEAGVEHTLSRIDHPERIERVRAFLAERAVVIADGHHRYETALAYRKEQRGQAGAEWTLAYFTNAYAPGSQLLPIHRLIRKAPVPTPAAWAERLSTWRQKTVPIAGADELPALLAEHLSPLASRHAFAADDGTGRMRIFWREATGGELSIRAVQREVIEGVFGLDEDAVRDGAVAYDHDARRVARELRAGGGSAALFVNPIAAHEVFDVTARGQLLPQKSTYFFPKLPTGLVFRVFEDAP